MEHLDRFSRRLLVVTLCICSILLCCALFVGVVGKTFAAPQPAGWDLNLHPDDMPSNMTVGLYQMQMIQTLDADEKLLARLIMWNTASGESRYYRYNNMTGAWELHPTQIATKGDF